MNMRIPPHSEEAERGILGSVLLDPQGSMRKVLAQGIEPEIFYGTKNRTLFSALKSMYEENAKGMDALTIAEYLKQGDILDDIGGYDFLVGLQDEVVVPAHVDHYSDIVRKLHRKRMAIEKASGIVDMAYRDEDTTQQIVEAVQELALGMSETEMESGKDEAIASIVESYEMAKRGEVRGIPTPFRRINRFTGGAPKGLVTVLCGRGGKGKSMFIAQWLDMLGKMGIPATSFCLEDGIETTMARMASCRGGYSHLKMAWGKGNPGWDALARKSLEAVGRYPIEFVSKKMTVAGIRDRLFCDKETKGIELAVIDGFKDIRRPAGKYNDTGFEEYISQELTDIARRLDIAIVTVLHLQKIPVDAEINITNIRGSAQIVNDCRVAWALQDVVHWTEKEQGRYGYGLTAIGSDGTPDVYAFHVLKINNGVVCRVPVRKMLDVSRFHELDAQDAGE